ncbi:hypothetical protein N7448_000731 [Penicillium atrosanguineum]|uniref:galacturonan 1,4-alpha-galacturonidase n=1 Tax=Penicillium atrosanguineum TaxID=1132637 RepID=A0A9W9Q3X9_9EURO|nr:hypothetical protein N7526_005610 [Penicillium atrosanguineum]KAJ5149153.1 hypothetical protein N7448_000731 [Penicillium atrosanguineum]KAJ5323939.1 hypothetical protein N7476_002539 [Penicillium atrosanguineum]
MRWLLSLALATFTAAYVQQDGSTCTLYPESLNNDGQAIDDAPSIHKAFDLCGHNGQVIFAANHTFNINTVMNTTNLVNCDVILRGELRWSTDISYWLSHSYSVVFQDQSTAWLFGGENVTFRSEEGGWYNGNGQAWYTQNQNRSNQPGRPISITFYNSTNLVVDGLNITQPQFWATFVSYSKNVSITNLYVNATSNDQWGTVNTDGYDSWNSDTLLVENAVIVNQDDCIAVKGNTTNLMVRNVTCYGNYGMAIGSVGQYPATPDYVTNVTFENIKCHDCQEAALIKTWQGENDDGSSNGDSGGGGSGVVKNIVFRDFEINNVALPIQISQCIYSESTSTCNTSKMAIEDITWSNIKGTSRYNIASSIYCSDVHPCPGLKFDNIEIQSVNRTLGLPMWNTNLQDEVYQCTNIVNGQGIPCNHAAPSNYGQTVTSNVQGTDASTEKSKTTGAGNKKGKQEKLGLKQ